MKESTFQANLIRRIKSAFPGSIVLKNDANYIQGFPDLLILYGDKWAVLECKGGKGFHLQPNQEYYVSALNKMGFSDVIYPENEDEVIDALSLYFERSRKE